MNQRIKKICFHLSLMALLLTACSPLNYLSAQPDRNISTSTQEPRSIQLRPCQLGNIQAQCGTLKVYENRAAQTGRRIDISVAVIQAQAANPAPDPIFYLAGGPGASAIEAAPYALKVLKSALQQRDLVLVDQRGTGGSNLLTCPRAIEEANYLVGLDDAMLRELKACLAQLDGDPAAYTTAWAMDDLDEVRAALGYEQINLYGESYGPTAEQVYLQRHGAHVRTMTLEGFTLLDVPMFERFPRSSQLALDLLFARCQADPACQSAYPHLRAEFEALLARVEQQPVDLGITSPNSGQPIRLTRDMLVQGVHNLLIQTPTAVLLPRLIHQMYQGNFDEIGQLAARSLSANAPTTVWKMMNLTIHCYEDWARKDPANTAQFSQGSYLRYADMRAYTVPEKVCALMPRPQPAALHQALGTSPVPVL